MRHLSIFFLLAGLATVSAQQQPDPAVVRLRDTLKNTMLQLRTVQTDLVTLQSEKDALEAEKKTLTDQVSALTKQAIEDKDTNDKKVTDLQTKLTAAESEIAAQKAAIEKWKVALQNMTNTAQTKEAERAKLAARGIVLDRQVADQKTKNAEMYRLGSEILNRYEKFGLGEALTAREPFVGLTRVKFENLIQDYSDKIKDQKIQP